jgi:hypothetical protein
MKPRTSWAAMASVSILTGLSTPVPAENYLFIRGDFHADGSLDLSDALAVVFYLFRDAGGPTCLDAGDANDDGALDVGDPVYILRHLFAGGPPPPSPFPECAPDQSLDLLGCAEQSSCPPVTNEIVDIRRTNSGIEIELFSSAPFPVRALAPALCIGGEEFVQSRGTPGGNLNTVIFLLTADEFARLRQGDPVTIQYGGCAREPADLVPFWDLWVFGPFDASLLENA